MDNSFQTSFIPKKPILSGGIDTSPKRSTTSISMAISVFIFVVIIFSTFGLYLYKIYLEKSKDNLSTKLLEARNKFDQNTITELESFDKRTSTAKQVLAGHLVISPLFELINKLTLPSIQFTDFEHSFKNDIFSVKMSGIARDYKSIATQADIFSKSEGSMLKDVVFSNLTKDKANTVTFDVEFDVDPLLLSYSNNVASTQSKADTTAVVEEGTSTTDTPNVEKEASPNQTILPASNETQ